MDDIGGTRAPANENGAVNEDRPAPTWRGGAMTRTLLGSMVALLLIAGTFYYFAGGHTGDEIVSAQHPRAAAERPEVAAAPARSAGTETPPAQTGSSSLPAFPQSRSSEPLAQPTPPPQAVTPPAAPSSNTPPADQAAVAPSAPPAAAGQEPALSGRATALPGNEEVLVVQRPRVNIRSEPGRAGRVIGTAVKGTQVKVIGRSGNWIEVEADAGRGWISASLLGPQSPASR